MKRFAVLINPSSAGGRTLALWPGFEKKLQGDGFQVTHHFSESEADFRNRVKIFARTFKYIAVCGGDSSLTIAAEELAQTKFSGELRFLPAGSVNDIILDIAEQQHGKKAPIYLGHLSAAGATHSFIGQANWGLGVVVNRWVRNILHTLPFLRPAQNLIGTLCIITAHILKREKVALTVQAGARTVSGEYSLVLVSQIRHWASGMLFCPGASYLTPEFQIVTIARCGLFRLIRIILAAKNGEHLGFPEVASIRAASIEVHSAKPLRVQIDGDVPDLESQVFKLTKKKSMLRLSL